MTACLVADIAMTEVKAHRHARTPPSTFLFQYQPCQTAAARSLFRPSHKAPFEAFIRSEKPSAIKPKGLNDLVTLSSVRISIDSIRAELNQAQSRYAATSYAQRGY